MIAQHEKQGGKTNHIVDIGAADGELTRNILSLCSDKVRYVTTIEPSIQRAAILRDIAHTIEHDGFDMWHMNNRDTKADFILASHVAYYFDNPTDAVKRMASHLNPDGTLGIILADWRSGKTELFNSANTQDLSYRVYDDAFPRQINGDALAAELSSNSEFEVSQPIRVPVPMRFKSEEEAHDRLRFMLAKSRLTEQEIRQSIQKSTHPQVDGSVLWGRDCMYFTLKNRRD